MREVRCAETVYLSRAQTDVDKRVDVGNHRRAVGQAQHPSLIPPGPHEPLHLSLFSPFHTLTRGQLQNQAARFKWFPTLPEMRAYTRHVPPSRTAAPLRRTHVNTCARTLGLACVSVTLAVNRICTSHVCVWECEGECVCG